MNGWPNFPGVQYRVDVVPVHGSSDILKCMVTALTQQILVGQACCLESRDGPWSTVIIMTWEFLALGYLVYYVFFSSILAGSLTCSPIAWGSLTKLPWHATLTFPGSGFHWKESTRYLIQFQGYISLLVTYPQHSCKTQPQWHLPCVCGRVHSLSRVHFNSQKVMVRSLYNISSEQTNWHNVVTYSKLLRSAVPAIHY